MNSKITILDRNGNQLIAQGLSYIVLAGSDYSHEYIFYTLNEVVNGDLTKIYVAKVNENNLIIDDNEWENVKRSMLAIVHKEEIIGLSYKNLFEENGVSKSFMVDSPRKIALKMDKLLGLQDEYRLAVSNPNSNSDTPAFGNSLQSQTQQTPVISNVPNTTIEVAPVTQVEAAPTVTVTPVTPVDSTPVVEVPVINNEVAQSAVTVTVASSNETPAIDNSQSVAPTMSSITPTAIPSAIDEIPAVVNGIEIPEDVEPGASDDFAIPVNRNPHEDKEMDSVIFDQIIDELNQIRTQNSDIQESIKKLTENVSSMSTTINNIKSTTTSSTTPVINTPVVNSQPMIEQPTVNAPAQPQIIQQPIINTAPSVDTQPQVDMINTNFRNTTEEVSAINIGENGQVVLPTYASDQQSAAQAANLISTNIVGNQSTTIEKTITPAPVSPSVVETIQPVVETPSVVSTPVNNVQTIPQMETVQPQIIQPVGNQPQMIEQAQLVPDVPVMGVNSPEPVIAVPEFDPNAGLPPVVMPQGVAAVGTSPVAGGIVDPLADIGA